MFDSIGWGEILVLVVAGLFILGPERLPEAAAWLARTIRKVRDFATGARDQLRGELGPEFDELRKPLEELRGLRDFNPRTAVRRTLFDNDPVYGDDQVKPNGHAPGPKPAKDTGSPTSGSANTGGANSGVNLAKPGAPTPHPAAPAVAPRLAPDERPPIDLDAT